MLVLEFESKLIVWHTIRLTIVLYKRDYYQNLTDFNWFGSNYIKHYAK